MWDFKLKKTRVIFIGSVVYSWLVYWAIGDTPFSNNNTALIGFLSPVLIYWIVIPLYRWIKKGK